MNTRMNTKTKIEVIKYWLENTDNNIGKIPTKLENKINDDDIANLWTEIGETKLYDFKRRLEEDVLREGKIKKQRFIFLKEWIYPILVPIIVAYLTIHFITPQPPILDIVAREYYDVPSSKDVILSYLIKNPNPYKITIYSPIGYAFTWTDYNPKGEQFIPITMPTLPTIESNNTKQDTKQDENNIILDSAGNEGDARIITLKFKTPSEKTEKIQVLTIIVNTDKGKVTKEIRLNVVKEV